MARRRLFKDYIIIITSGPHRGGYFHWDVMELWYWIQDEWTEEDMHGSVRHMYRINPDTSRATYVSNERIPAIKDIPKPCWVERLSWVLKSRKVIMKRRAKFEYITGEGLDATPISRKGKRKPAGPKGNARRALDVLVRWSFVRKVGS